MSFIDTDGRSARFLTRAQNRAITIESAPRSSKKWLSTGTLPRTHDLGQHRGEAALRYRWRARRTPHRPAEDSSGYEVSSSTGFPTMATSLEKRRTLSSGTPDP